MGVSRNQPSWDKFRHKNGLKHGYRSGLEEKNAESLKRRGIPVVFEQVKVQYLIPSTTHTYSPDFELPNGILVETKGKFEPKDRAKHLYLKICHPDLDIRFVFQKPNAPIAKGAKTTHAQWADKYGFKWAAAIIPDAWLREPPRDPKAKRGPRTIPLPQAALDHFANTAQQPLKAGRIKAG